MWCLVGSRYAHTVRCRVDAVNLLPNLHKWHPTAGPWGWDVGCLLWYWSLIFKSYVAVITVLIVISCKLDCIMAALDYKHVHACCILNPYLDIAIGQYVAGTMNVSWDSCKLLPARFVNILNLSLIWFDMHSSLRRLFTRMHEQTHVLRHTRCIPEFNWVLRHVSIKRLKNIYKHQALDKIQSHNIYVNFVHTCLHMSC